jgi:hypothetical protein
MIITTVFPVMTSCFSVPSAIILPCAGIAVEGDIGCPTSGVPQRGMREAAPHPRGVSKARQL